MTAPGLPGSRNAPCPCGSGKRYKHCHGASAQTAIPAAANAADRHALAGIAAHDAGNLDEAERHYRHALSRDPANLHAAHNLAVVALQRQRFGDALPALEASVAAYPDDVRFLDNLGVAYAGLDRYADAEAQHRRALALRPDLAPAWNNLGLALVAQRRLDEAIEAFGRALAVSPQYPKARWNRATARLALGDRAGWEDVDARLDVLEPGTGPGIAGVPRLTARDAVGGKTVLVDAEQGHGDMLQFARFATTLAERGARVIVRAHAPLAELVATLRGVAGVVGIDEAPPCDAWIAVMSLPALLGVDPRGEAVEMPYLHVDAARVAAARASIACIPARRRLGLSWAGNPEQVNDRRRSCPLAALAPLLERDDVAWFSLQHVDGEDQLASVPSARRLHLPDQRHDFAGKSALVAALDGVVSVCTSSAHLAGALGRPLAVLLSHAPDWRWGVDGDTTGWYPTARLFRQGAPGDWAGVARNLGRALDAGQFP